MERLQKNRARHKSQSTKLHNEDYTNLAWEIHAIALHYCKEESPGSEEQGGR